MNTGLRDPLQLWLSSGECQKLLFYVWEQYYLDGGALAKFQSSIYLRIKACHANCFLQLHFSNFRSIDLPQQVMPISLVSSALGFTELTRSFHRCRNPVNQQLLSGFA